MLKLDAPALVQMTSGAGYWYLATAYSKHPAGLDAAHEMACRAVGALRSLGVVAFSPIAHWHPVGRLLGINPLDHDLWMEIDKPMMEGAEGLIVLCSPGWQASRGIAVEIDFFRESCLPVYGMPYAG
ncbi:DUF1937 family protein [Ancylobacter polymorphus]|uniref:DUF1937 domain-containing protein n=1 Tax=Ancylobacter polymorphus TaxID=223390 RepID=A0ABU0BHP6_9HYPH|nr:DUF1937 family protein [Ancylobacter polymorphus]MDQ0305360.1 hypothetical protein [Ancylobacter polymorphus]